MPPSGDKKPSKFRIDVYLDRDQAEITEDGKSVRAMKIKGGRPTHPTHPGTLKILPRRTDDEKHTSSKYGTCMDASGVGRSVDNGSASCAKGETYHGAPMPFFSRFNGAEGFHAGSLTNPSHGCIHLGAGDAEWLYRNIPEGTPVIVHERRHHAKK
jgi:lipoprotein-anchoring transpeptidase ErfK/SrfK